MPRQILHIDLDAFFASVEQAMDPRLKGLPVIVGAVPGTVRGVVAAASYEARALGMKTAMPLGQAQRIAPHAVFLPGRYHHYRAVSDQFMAILGDFSPDVEPFSMDEAWVDLTGFEPFYGSSKAAAQVIQSRIREELGITASVGIATSRVVAKVASEREKPNGLVVVPPGQEAAFLAPLPIRELPMVGEKTEVKLRQYGVETVGQLAAMSPNTLKHMLGVMGQVLLRLAHGQDSASLQPEPAEAKSVSRSTTLTKDTLDRRLLHSLLYYLSERVAAELRKMGKQTRSPVLKLRYSDFDTISRHRTLSDPTDAQQGLFQTAKELLEVALQEKGQLVRLIGVGAENLVEMGPQLRMFDPDYIKKHRLNRAVDDLRGRYGFPSVQQGRTFVLNGDFPQEREGFVLKTPSLSR